MSFEPVVDILFPEGLGAHPLPEGLPPAIEEMGRTLVRLTGEGLAHLCAMEAWLAEVDVPHTWRPGSSVPEAVAAPHTWFTVQLPGLYARTRRSGTQWRAGTLALRDAEVVAGGARWEKCRVCMGNAWMVRTGPLHLRVARSPDPLFALAHRQWVARSDAWEAPARRPRHDRCR